MNKIYQKALFGIKNAGFTLIELLIVVLIIGILSAVALPQYQVAVEKSRAAEGLALLGPLTTAQENYKMANGSYSRDFEALDVSVPLDPRGSACGINLSYSSPMFGNKNWGIVLDRNLYFKTPVFVIRVEGPFQCYGFFKEDGKTYCVEDVSKHTQEMCKKLGGVLEKNVGGWNIYRL